MNKTTIKNVTVVPGFVAGNTTYYSQLIAVSEDGRVFVRIVGPHSIEEDSWDEITPEFEGSVDE